MLGKFSEEWDNLLLELMSKHEFEEKDIYTVKIGGIEVWIQNYPYSCFIPYVKGNKLEGYRPRRRTIVLAQKKLKKEFLKNKLTEV